MSQRADSADGSDRNGAGTKDARRPLWVRIAAMVILLALIATLIVVRTRGGRRKTKIAEAAERTTPEMAVLLHEIDDVACTLVETFPDSPEAIQVMAQLHYRLGESDEAVRYWNEALKLDPKFGPAYHSLGLLYLETGDHAKSAKYFRKTLDLEPQSSAFAVELAQALIADGKTKEAETVLRKDIQLHPKAMASLAMLGHACVQLRKYEEAKRYFEAAIEIGPDYTNAYNGLVTACANLGEDELAKKYAEKLKLMKAQEEKTHRTMLKSFDDAENVKLTMSVIYTAAANVYLLHEDPVTAEKYLLRSIELNPKAIAAREVLGWLYRRQGRDKEAVKVVLELLKLAPNSVRAQLSGGQMCAELDWFEEAEQAYRRAIELTPRQAGGYLALAGLYLDKGRKLAEARKLAEKAVDLEPTAKNYFLLGGACFRSGDVAAARVAARQAAALDPFNREYQQAVQAMGGQN